jgi:large subunit ribosomal protein L25
MDDFEIVAETRTEHGKGDVRRLRRAGLTPGVLYGESQDPVSFKLPNHVIRKQLENEAFFSHILTVNIDGKPSQAVLKAVQRNPATSDVMHIDLLRISAMHKITMQVPIHLDNEDKAAGLRAGGTLARNMNEVEINCLPKDLPEFLSIDITDLNIGEALHLSELPLPEGVEIPALAQGPEHDFPIVSIHETRAMEIEEAEEGVVEEEEGTDEVESDDDED